jgi:hypothetical protein
MTDLVIAYVLDGPRPGYAFTTPPNGTDPETLKAIWRQAMPRGQGWRHYIGARTLKCFPLDGGRRAAIARVTVTDQADEIGRQGIRRAEITILSGEDILDYLALRLAMLPEAARAAAEERLTLPRWTQILDRALPKARRRAGQIVLAAPYTDAAGWQVVEAAVLMIATAPPLRLASGWPRIPPLTTLALDTREESRLVAVPLTELPRLHGVKPIKLD